MKLTSQAVQDIFEDVLFKEGEDTSNHVKVEGILANFGFHPERLEKHRQEIIELLNELEDSFKEGSGGGMSFLQACNDKHGNQWTDLHRVMEQLFCLGIGIDKAQYLMPRELWSALPGGMPYIVIKK